MTYVDTAGNLATAGPSGTANSNLGLGVYSGTSPSITGYSSSYQVVFSASGSHDLYDYGTTYSGDAGYTTLAGTSPSVAGTTAGCCQDAFVNTSGDLETVGPVGNETPSLGVASGTSPTIAGIATGGYEVAFLGSGTDALWIYGTFPSSYSWNDTGLTGESGTTPSISPRLIP
ncbi:MAG: hypothetical protein ABSH29_21595 [Acidimicrobiales bacterium]